MGIILLGRSVRRARAPCMELEILLYQNNLEGDIPPEIGDFPFMQILNLSGNQLTGGIPSELGNLTDLITLSFVIFTSSSIIVS